MGWTFVLGLIFHQLRPKIGELISRSAFPHGYEYVENHNPTVHVDYYTP